MANSQLAGVPPVDGLYASLLPLPAYARLRSPRQLIVAPDGATRAIIAAVVTPLAGADLLRYLSLTRALTLITGVFCIVAGLACMGFPTNSLTRRILTGYLNGIALPPKACRALPLGSCAGHEAVAPGCAGTR